MTEPALRFADTANLVTPAAISRLLRLSLLALRDTASRFDASRILIQVAHRQRQRALMLTASAPSDLGAMIRRSVALIRPVKLNKGTSVGCNL